MTNRMAKWNYIFANLEFFLAFYICLRPVIGFPNTRIPIMGYIGIGILIWLIYVVCYLTIACWSGFKIQKKLGYPPHDKLLELTKRYNTSKSIGRKKATLEANKLPEDATPHDASELELLGKEKKHLPFCAFIMHPKARQGFRYTIVAFVAVINIDYVGDAWPIIGILMMLLIAVIFMIALWRTILAVMDVA